MACFSNCVDLGCFNFCSDIDIGVTASQSGSHTFIFTLGTNSYSYSADFTSGNSITVSGDYTNESETHILEIQQPDGVLIDFGGGVTCAQFTTRIISGLNPTSTSPDFCYNDCEAFHTDVSDEFSDVSLKPSPVGSDRALIEDSEDGFSKKYVPISNFGGGGGGETNTASNAGTGGIGFFDGKVGVDLEFRNAISANNLLTISLDAPDKEVEFTINEGNFTKPNVYNTDDSLTSDRTITADGNDFTLDSDADIDIGSDAYTYEYWFGVSSDILDTLANEAFQIDGAWFGKRSSYPSILGLFVADNTPDGGEVETAVLQSTKIDEGVSSFVKVDRNDTTKNSSVTLGAFSSSGTATNTVNSFAVTGTANTNISANQANTGNSEVDISTSATTGNATTDMNVSSSVSGDAILDIDIDATSGTSEMNLDVRSTSGLSRIAMSTTSDDNAATGNITTSSATGFASLLDFQALTATNAESAILTLRADDGTTDNRIVLSSGDDYIIIGDSTAVTQWNMTTLRASSVGQALIATDTSGNTTWGQPRVIESFQLSCSDLTSDLATGTSVAYHRVPYAFTVTEVRASVLTAPTGSGITVDINEGGTSILSTLITIDATDKTSEDATTPPVISDSSLADDAEITIDIDAVGSTVAGAGLIVTIIGYQT